MDAESAKKFPPSGEARECFQFNYKIFLKNYKFALTNDKMRFTITAVYRMSVYNLTMKEDITMKNRMIALVLVFLMLSVLAACGKSRADLPPEGQITSAAK